MALAAQLHTKKNVGNHFSLYSPLYSSSRSTVCEEFENESRNGHCYKNFEFFSFKFPQAS